MHWYLIRCRAAAIPAVVLAVSALAVAQERSAESSPQAKQSYAKVFDEHWQRLHDSYPYFDLYKVDWEAEREYHRPRAVAAKSGTEFVWEMSRLLAVLPDAHVSYMPPIEVLKSWAVPDLQTIVVERQPLVRTWGAGVSPDIPAAFVDDPHAYPEVVSVAGAPIGCCTELLAGGPPGTSLTMRLRWPDGQETDQVLHRPQQLIKPPKNKHYGRKWIASGRVGSVGYLRIKSFDPTKGTLGPAGKMTPILRKHLAALGDTKSLILDLQRNGGGLVAASDPFLSHFLDKRMSYRWGNSGGKSRTLVPRSPRYRGAVVAIVDEKSASGGEWAARILRDAGRAKVIGGRSMGAEAAVKTSKAMDGSAVHYSAWPMTEPGVTPFQERGVTLDHAVPLTINLVRKHGYEEAVLRVRRQRFAKALELLGAAARDLDALLKLADEADSEERESPR